MCGLIGLKVLDGTGVGKTSDVIEALEFVDREQVQVERSRSSTCRSGIRFTRRRPTIRWCRRFSRRPPPGLIVVTSAGNNGHQRDDRAAGLRRCLVAVQRALRDLRRRDEHAEHRARAATIVSRRTARRGPSWYDGFAKPDVVAPGHKLAADANTSSYLYQDASCQPGDVDERPAAAVLSGTSMAAGVASGVAALVLDAHNSNDFTKQKPLTANLVKAMLQYSAIPIAGSTT